MSLEFSRVTRTDPCPICKKDTWCEVGDRAVLCMRVESDHPNTRSAGGWYHHFEDNNFVRLRPMPKKATAPPINALSVMVGWLNGRTAATIDDQTLYFAKLLGVSRQSLLELEAVWSPFDRAWGFPMKDGRGNSIGIRLRNYDGRKWAVRGSRSGLFYGDPRHLLKCDLLFVCEGPTDTAAALTMGLAAIGKPCCNACNDFVLDLIRVLHPKRVVLVSDVDSMSQNGIGFTEAQKLQKQLSVKSVIWAPQAKDIRAFLNAGGSAALIENDIRSMLWR